MATDSLTDTPLPPGLAALDRLVSPATGLVGQVSRISRTSDDLHVFSATMGHLELVHANISASGGRPAGTDMGGGGGGVHAETARAVAIAEALERYSSCVLPTDLIWATPRELGDRAIDLDTLPQCSDSELAHPKCPASRVDPDEKMRWTTAWSLTGGRPVMVPAVNVWMHIPPLTASERYTMPISTGCATHTDIRRALASAICEVIERDAISLTWLQRLPLKRVVFDDVPEALARSLEATAAKGIVTTFFDATSELGVPTLYSVDESRADTKVRHVVMCATDLDPAAAATKMLREVASSRIALSRHEPPPASWDDFTSVFHGAMFMGAPEQSSAYDFLLRQDNGARPFSTMPTLSTDSAEDDLQLLLRTLDAHGMEALAVEMTTREAALVGFRVVRVIIPQLMPLAFTHRARFLGHRRLYDGPVAMGFPAHPEADINPFPQPFA